MNKHSQIGVLRKAYNIEKGDDFYSRFIFGHGNIRTCVYGREKQLEYDKSFRPVFQNLLEMKLVKDKCITIISKHIQSIETGSDGKFHRNQIDVNEPIDDELNIFFKDFFIRGVMAIDALIAHSNYMESNIGFLFASDDKKKKFRKGLKNFILKENDDRFKVLRDFIMNNRATWYEPFKKLRDDIEHHRWHLPDLKYTLDKNNKVRVHLPTSSDQAIEQTLGSYWKNMNFFCEEVVVFLLSLKLKDDMIIVYVPEEKRDKHFPVRYIVGYKNFSGFPLQCG